MEVSSALCGWEIELFFVDLGPTVQFSVVVRKSIIHFSIRILIGYAIAPDAIDTVCLGGVHITAERISGLSDLDYVRGLGLTLIIETDDFDFIPCDGYVIELFVVDE